MALGVWTDNGVVVAPVSSDTPGQPNVLYEANPQILTPNGDGKIFKMWFGSANGMCYAESNDGLTSWTRYSGNPVAVPSGSASAGWNAYPKIFKNGSTYYAYIVAKNFLSMTAWTSTDGITWTQQVTGIFSGGGTFVGQLAVIGQSGGTWYGYYTKFDGTNYDMFLATSIDLLNWTGSGSPAISAGTPSNFTFQKIGNAYYGWSQIVQAGIPALGSNGCPSDISRYVSANLNGPWAGPLPASTAYRTLSTEGIGSTTGQIADPCLINVNGVSYMYVTVTPTGNGAPTNYQIACLTTPLTLAQLVQTNEGMAGIPHPSSYGFADDFITLATDSFTSGDPNWTQLTSTSGWNAPTFGTGSASSTGSATRSTAYYSGGSISWPNNQWASATLLAVQNGSVYASALLRGSTSGAATCYMATVQGALGGSTSTFIQKFVANAYTEITDFSHTWNVNDVVTFAVVGTTLSLYQNGNLIWQGSDSAIASGAPGISLYGDGTAAHCAFSAFSAGAIGNSVGGNVGQSGVTISAGGNITTSDAGGNYTLAPETGAVTITPSLTGYTFSPTSASETVSGSNITGVNFTAVPLPPPAGSSFGFGFKLDF